MKTCTKFETVCWFGLGVVVAICLIFAFTEIIPILFENKWI